MKQALIWTAYAWCLMLGPVSAESFTVPGELWHSSRSGQAVRDNPQLNKAFNAYLQMAQPQVRIHHQKRDESTAQAEELRGWLIALGIESDRIQLLADNVSPPLIIDITDRR